MDIRWVGNATNHYSIGTLDDGVWVGYADGSGTVVASVSGDRAFVVNDWVFYMAGQPEENGYESVLWLVEPGHPPRAIGSGSQYAIASRAGSVVVTRVDSAGLPGGVVKTTIADGSEAVVIPPSGMQQSAVAVTPDGRSIAAGYCGFQGESAGFMHLAIDGHVQVLPGFGTPIGFDTSGKLVYWKGCSQGDISRVSASGVVENLMTAPYSEARVTSDGRYLIAWLLTIDATDQELRIVDLESREESSYSVNGSWNLSMMGGNEFAILEGPGTDPGDQIYLAVVSLDGHWIGGLEPVAR